MSEVIVRPDWATYFLDIAGAVSWRASCPRLSVGAVFVGEDRQILATGYNGAPRGMPHCIDDGCVMVDGHCKRALHAERNAIIMAARHGINLKDSVCYATHQSCADCVIHLVQLGVRRIYYRYPYKNELAVQFAKDAGLHMEQVIY